MPKVVLVVALICMGLGLVAVGYLLDQRLNARPTEPVAQAAKLEEDRIDNRAAPTPSEAKPSEVKPTAKQPDILKKPATAQPDVQTPVSPPRAIPKLKPDKPSPRTMKLPPGVRAPTEMDKNTRQIGVPQPDPTKKIASKPPVKKSVGPTAEPGPIPPRAELIQQMKAGTALLFNKDGPIGAAFCVDQKGLFLTTGSVVKGLEFGQKLQMLVGSGNTKKVKTTFDVDGDGYNGLSLVLAGRGPKGETFSFNPLRIGDTSGLIETDELIIGGYSVIDRKNVSRSSWNAAAMSVLVKRIKTIKYTSTSTQKVMKILLDQEDDSSHFTQGGPVLDKNGLLIGIVGRVGPDGREIIPIHRFLSGLRRRPYVTVIAPTTISEGDFAKQIPIKVKTPRRFTGDDRKLKVRAGIRYASSRGKSLPVLEETAPNEFAGKLSFLSQSERERVDFKTIIDGLTVKGSIKARKFKVGGATGRTIDLLSVERITWLKESGPDAKIEFRSGESLVTTLDPDLWRNVSYVIGNRPLTVNFREAKSIEFPAPDVSNEYTIRIQVYDDRDRLVELTHKIGMSRVPKLAEVISTGASDDEKPLLSATYSRQAIQLPAEPRDVCFGGGGRLMFIAMKGSSQIAIIDFDLKKRVGFFDAGSEDFLFAAGLSELFVRQQDTSHLQSFDLNDLSKPPIIKKKNFRDCLSMAMGESSDSPLVTAGRSISVLDAKSLHAKGNFRLPEIDLDNAQLRVSANGHLTTYYDGRRLEVIQHSIGSKSKREDTRTTSWGQIFPSFDGRWILTRTGAIRSGGSNLQSFDSRDRKTSSASRSGSNSFEQLVPARSGDLYLAVVLEKERKTFERTWAISVNQLGNEARLAELPAIKDPPRFKNPKNPQERNITLEKQIVFDPARDLIGFLGDSQFYLFSLDINNAIKSTIGNYISIVSLPPESSDRKKEFQYQVKAKTNAEKLTYSLPVCPEGMTISEDGLIKWKPQDLKRSKHQVIVSLSDGENVEVFHKFEVRFQ